MNNTVKGLMNWGGGKYSQEERVVGEWIDGKPIYQKTFIVSGVITVSSSTLSTLIADVSSLNIDVLVDYWGQMRWNQTIPYTIPFVLVGSSSIFVDCVLDGNNFYLRSYRNSSTTKIDNIRVTIQYTKTTDTPK